MTVAAVPRILTNQVVCRFEFCKVSFPIDIGALMDMQQHFDTAVDKTDKGFGIYFTKVAGCDGDGDVLAVDGFVEDPVRLFKDGKVMTSTENLAALQLGDILTKVNGEGCQKKEVTHILDMLRAAGIGPNTLSFSRNVPVDATLKDEASANNGVDEATDSVFFEADAPKSGFMGALLKVKSKIRAEIDGDEEEQLREQREDEQFEKQWLEEFELLKKQYEEKWETCTYTADEFCGLLYRSSDSLQKESLLQVYPTLMEAWKDGRASSSTSRVIPEWPAAKLTYDCAVNYVDPAGCFELAASSAEGGASPRSIHCSQSLQSVLECLRVGFMWRSDDLRAFCQCLDAAGVSSCSGLVEALDARSRHFERNFQSTEYPRLSKTMLRALRVSAHNAVASPSESTSFLRSNTFQRSTA